MDEFARTTPVKPPMVNKKTKPMDQYIGTSDGILDPFMVASQLNTLTPVGMAIIIVADVK